MENKNLNNKSIKEPTDEKKKQLLSHLLYQIGMMRRCFYRCLESSFHFQVPNQVDEDLMVAFLTNIRTLHKFFIKPGIKYIEAHAGDYISGWKVEDDEMNRWYNQINSYLSHLDYERVKGEKGYEIYQITKLYTYFRELIIKFIDQLNKYFITQELLNLSEQLKREKG
jgi:hypothetical protein